MHSLKELIELNDSKVKTPVKNDVAKQNREHDIVQREEFRCLCVELETDGRIDAVYQGPETSYGLNFGHTGKVKDLLGDFAVFVTDDGNVAHRVEVKDIFIGRFGRTLAAIIKEAE